MSPTLKEQMEWLDLIKGLLHSDNAPMILAIKENLIAVRNMEVFIERELDKFQPHVDRAINNLLEKGEEIIDFKTLGMSTAKPLIELYEVDSDNGDTVRVSLPNLRPGEVMELISEKTVVTTAEDRIVHTIESIERYNENNPEKPFEFRSEFLNDRERNVLKSRISKLQEEIQFQYQLPKVLRRPRGIKEAQERIATLKKWMNESTLDR